MRLYLILLIFILSSCEYLDKRVIVRNRTNEPLYYFIFNRDSLLNLKEDFDDTTIRVYYTNYLERIGVNDSLREGQLGAKDEWEKYVMRGDSQKLYVYIFNKDTLEKYDWRTIVENENYQKRYTYSFDFLKFNNWNIILR